MRFRSLTFALFFIPISLCAVDSGEDYFEKKVRPLLAERCYECHSAEKKIKGGLNLDSREGWAKGGDTGPAILPGDTAKSLLLEAVRYANRDLQMPPKQALPPHELAILENWVRMGAPDPRNETSGAKKQAGLSVDKGREFWSYVPPRLPALPEVRDAAWPRTDIDRFLLAKMEKAKAAPAPDAAPEALARRLHLNLTGLPPSPEQLAAFLKDAANDRVGAVTRLTDALLESRRFGEAWGRHWLDVARFAESSGGGRTLLFKDSWRYRDYVIDAVNADVPFDRFIREQLAGDLLPAESPADRRRNVTATAFLALGATNYEEQDKQQLRFDIIDEQLETLGRAFLGQTIGCARCHDHKFDPIPQRDYYALAGVLASTRTLENYTDNVARWISAPLPSEGAREAEILNREQQLARVRKELDATKAELSELSKSVTAATGKPGKPLEPAQLAGIVLDDAEAKIVGEWKHSTHVRSFIGRGYLSDDNMAKGEKTVTFTPAIPKTARYEVRLAYTHAAGRAKNVRINILHADGEDTVYLDQSEPPSIEGRFASLGKFRFEQDGAGYVMVSNEGTNGHVTVDALQLLEEGTQPAPRTELALPGQEARKKARELEASLKKLTQEGPFRDMAMAVRDEEQVGDTQLRIRGVERQKGESVPRGFLQVTLAARQEPLPPDVSGRRELAEWIASASNPLTARVQVNRVWGWLFGTGIVRTVDNFGTTGEAPSHPELLDYLAIRFQEEGWSLKKLVREIVLSRAWQTEVQASPASDPENRLFSHANRRRLSAEQIRDSILSVSGKLDLKEGGPNIGGAGEIDANTSAAQNVEYSYVYSDVRRSVYTPAFRNKRLELFEVFDFGNINQSISQRNTSTVAPQALYLLNHPFVVENAAAAAERSLNAPLEDEARLARACLEVLGRRPSLKEARIARRFLDESRSTPAEAWAQLYQMLFACMDFRYMD
jgi:hypothetical protein